MNLHTPEQTQQSDIARILAALERIADALEAQNELVVEQEPEPVEAPKRLRYLGSEQTH